MANLEQLMKSAGLVVIYDGLCPLCANYVQMLRLRQSVRTVELIDARFDQVLVSALADAGYKLDDGMLAIYGQKAYYGRDAVTLLSRLTESKAWINRATATVLGRPFLARLVYPAMTRGRSLLLWLLRRPRLRA